jgi:SAM-dependent methyltransferase
MRLYCSVSAHYNEGVPPIAPDADPPPYRTVRAAADEGEAFLQELDRLTDVYVTVMGGRVRDDGPGVRLKWSRDWEYPWIVTRARLAAGTRVLDCGAGNSPVPLLMASRGATVVAVDRDVVIASRSRYAGMVALDWMRGLVGLPLRLSNSEPHAPAAGAAATVTGSSSPAPRRPLAVRAWSFLRHNLVRRHRVAFSRIARPDFWGPVSPSLLARFGVDYRHADLTRLPFADASFDLVSCISVLEHMPPETRAKGVREMSRVLRPGGQLLLTYDLQERDLTRELIEAGGLEPVELARLEGVVAPNGRRRPDAIGLHLVKPAAPAADAAGSGRLA